jgi:hypothetical protein
VGCVEQVPPAQPRFVEIGRPPPPSSAACDPNATPLLEDAIDLGIQAPFAREQAPCRVAATTWSFYPLHMVQISSLVNPKLVPWRAHTLRTSHSVCPPSPDCSPPWFVWGIEAQMALWMTRSPAFFCWSHRRRTVTILVDRLHPWPRPHCMHPAFGPWVESKGGGFSRLDLSCPMDPSLRPVIRSRDGEAAASGRVLRWIWERKSGNGDTIARLRGSFGFAPELNARLMRGLDPSGVCHLPHLHPSLLVRKDGCRVMGISPVVCCCHSAGEVPVEGEKSTVLGLRYWVSVEGLHRSGTGTATCTS